VSPKLNWKPAFALPRVAQPARAIAAIDLESRACATTFASGAAYRTPVMEARSEVQEIQGQRLGLGPPTAPLGESLVDRDFRCVIAAASFTYPYQGNLDWEAIPTTFHADGARLSSLLCDCVHLPARPPWIRTHSTSNCGRAKAVARNTPA